MSAPEGGNLSRVASRGAALTLAYQLGGQILTIGSTMVVARLLAPDDYGILGFALLVGLPLAGLVDLGLSAAVSRAPHVSEEDLSTAFWATVAGFGVGSLFAVPVALNIAYRFGVGSDRAVIAFGAVAVLAAVPAAVPRGLLARRFQFGRLALGDFGGQLASGAAAVVVAFVHGSWALEAALAARSAAVLGLGFGLSKFRPSWTYSWERLRPLLHFGGRTAVSGFFSYASRNVDNLVVARAAGSTALGLYRIAFGIALMPFAYLGATIGNVGVPVYGSVASDEERMRIGFVRGLRLVALLNTGTMIALWWLADDAVRLLYGHKYLLSVTPLRILCAGALFYPLAALSGSVMLGLGRADIELRLSALRTFATGLFAVVGWMLGGVDGVAWGVSTYAAIMFALDAEFAARLARVPRRSILGALLPSALAGGVTAILLAVLESLVDIGPWERLPVTLGGAAVYVAIAHGTDPQAVQQIVSLWTSRARFRRVGSSAAS